MDCKEAKEFLSQHGIKYIEYDLTRDPDKEEEMKKRTGSRIVSAFVIRDTTLPSFIKRPKIFIGFEVNKNKIIQLLKVQNRN
ncbi:NrdH-redoxin [Bacillus sp. ISL-47]|uniref:glutaredoxin family protein n=1 Tax=Bacillus sp. ISL-47 TaxID=2819130 RepID=UPI001BE7AC0F|nr:glutaredoxin domain-containing protein [Bacillus sp. ISL-47]MBT2691288.1 NrdH-redoxin [Bacillus sp. ISL-47]MBT2710556.1 NrdH-redoxin [Pseudomonas sp. ISL-84]